MSYVESKLSIESFIAKLKYAIKHHTARIILQLIRKVDENRAIRFSNGFAIADLFPDENPVEKLKHELAALTIDNYIESIHDSRFPDRSDMRVFGKRYPKGDIYKNQSRVDEPSSFRKRFGFCYVIPLCRAQLFLF